MIEKSRQEAGEGGGELYGANALRRTQTQAAAGRSSALGHGVHALPSQLQV